MEWPAYLPLVRGGGVTISGVCLVPWKIERKIEGWARAIKFHFNLNNYFTHDSAMHPTTSC